jgi:hypothetical protein
MFRRWNVDLVPGTVFQHFSSVFVTDSVTNGTLMAAAATSTKAMRTLDVEKRCLAPIQHVENRALSPS